MRGIIAAIGICLSVAATAANKKATVVTPPPIEPFKMVTTPVPEKFGDWSVIPYGGGAYLASTPNDNGSALGVYCSGKGCVSFINPQITCEEDDKYPALANSASAAFSVLLTCGHVQQRPLLFFDDEKALVDAMSIGGQFGLAFPMKAGDFKVSRFSLAGAMRAYTRAAQLAHTTAPEPSKGLGDHRL